MATHESLSRLSTEMQGNAPGSGGMAAARGQASVSVQPQAGRTLSAHGFYQQYRWALNPLLSLEECMERMGGELQLLKQPLADWQRAEVHRNLFLLAAAVDQITCDYLTRGHYDFSKLVKPFPWLRLPVRLLHRVNQRLVAWREFFLDNWVTRWQTQWRQLTLESANLLLKTHPAPGELDAFAEHLALLSRQPLPASLKARRLKLPSAFCSMDLTHLDYFALADKFVDSFPDRNEPLLILGLRSAGNYLGPLVESRLRAHGFKNLLGLAIRPKVNGLSAHETSTLRRAAREHRRVLVVDDLPTSGKTLRVACELLVEHGVHRSRLVLVIPEQPEYELREKLEQGNYPAKVARIELKVEEWWKVRWLHSDAARRIVELLAEEQGKPGQVSTSGQGVETQERELDFGRRYGLRLKKLYTIKPGPSAKPSSPYVILAKSMGWGWFAYHVWLVSEGLREQLPCAFGMREGVLFMEWVPGVSVAANGGIQAKSMVHSLAEYVARRARELPLPQSLPLDLIDRGNTSWDYLAESLAGANGRAVAKLAMPAVRRKLIQEFGNAPCALIDAKLMLDKWLLHDGRLFKLDFEGHGIDNADLYMADPAFDLAAAVFEFSLSPAEEEALLARYAESSGDRGIAERLPGFKQLYGLRELHKTGERLAKPPRAFDRAAAHARFQRARRFLVDSLLRHYGHTLPVPAGAAATNALFVLDVDGVLDEYMYEYPATTLGGLEALALLHRHDIPIVLNTERSLEDVQAYSQFFHFLGGVAEHGTILWDAQRGREKILIDAETRDQMDLMRTLLSADESVFFSSGYRASLHCFTYGGGAARCGLEAERVQALLQREGLHRLRAVCRKGETTIVARSLDKGTGLVALKEFLELPGTLILHAIGNAEEDLPMFRAAEHAYAVANSTKALKAVSAGAQCRMLKHSSQRGLREAAQLAVAQITGRAPERRTLIPPSVVERDPLLRAARAADRSKLRRSLALFHRDLLGLFQI